ncbi:hypothetical protein P3S68_028521 [Capsicum galapagoense]
MDSSHHEVNPCRDIVPYVPPVQILVLAPTPISSQPLQNDVGTMIVSQHPVVRKSRLVTTIVKSTTLVHFIIVPSKGEEDIYTIKEKEDGDEPSDPHGINLDYHDKLHGWVAQRRQRQNGKCETFYFHKSKDSMCRSINEVRRHIFQGEKLKVEINLETKAEKVIVIKVANKRSKKRKGESSISEKECAAKKHKSNGGDNYEKIEVEKFLKDAQDNLTNMDETQRQGTMFLNSGADQVEA